MFVNNVRDQACCTFSGHGYNFSTNNAHERVWFKRTCDEEISQVARANGPVKPFWWNGLVTQHCWDLVMDVCVLGGLVRREAKGGSFTHCVNSGPRKRVLKNNEREILTTHLFLYSSGHILRTSNFFKSTREIFKNPILRTSNCSKYCRPCSKCSVVLSYPWGEANLEHMPNFRELPKYMVSNMSLVHFKLSPL